MPLLKILREFTGLKHGKSDSYRATRKQLHEKQPETTRLRPPVSPGGPWTASSVPLPDGSEKDSTSVGESAVL